MAANVIKYIYAIYFYVKLDIFLIEKYFLERSSTSSFRHKRIKERKM